MKEAIYNYLDRRYIVQGNAIYDLMKDDSPVLSSGMMIAELMMIFNLTKRPLKKYLKCWWLEKNLLDFEKFWKTKFQSPKYTSNSTVSGTTIVYDLVPKRSGIVSYNYGYDTILRTLK